MSRNLFVYGTLTFPEIVEALTGKSFMSKQAVLKNYAVKCLNNRVYPGLIEARGKLAKGYLLEDVDADTVSLITDWEGGEYACVDVYPMIGNEKIKASAFIYTSDGLLVEEWSREMFKNSGNFNNYVNNGIPNYLKLL